jgi:hypothetical protein
MFVKVLYTYRCNASLFSLKSNMVKIVCIFVIILLIVYVNSQAVKNVSFFSAKRFPESQMYF